VVLNQRFFGLRRIRVTSDGNWAVSQFLDRR
jgi:hypothetical protein